MRLKNLLTLILAVSTSAYAQLVYTPTTVSYISSPSASPLAILAPQDPLDIVRANVAVDPNTELKRSYDISSPFARHVTYDQYVSGIPVKNAGVKIHLRMNGSYLIQNYLADASGVSGAMGDFLLPTSEGITPVYANHTGGMYPTVVYTTADGTELLVEDELKYNRRDTTIFAKVFSINPINSSGLEYGALLADSSRLEDNNDANNVLLDQERYWKTMKARVDGDTFFLESDYMFFEDFALPTDSTAYFFNDSMDYRRFDQEFEFVNVYYHINTIGEYTDLLGYDSLTQVLMVDPHGFGGRDNSAYTPGLHRLQFGEGGVDDAEDGEVIVHEFVHSLSEIASPENTTGRERQAMEEGACDYYAKAYSRSINDNTPNKIFSWDGNLTWDGIPLNTNRIYPVDLKNSKDEDRDMWSSALMCVHDAIGREATDSLLLEHFYYQAPNTTMAEMAQVIVDIDESDFESRYYDAVMSCFVSAGFLSYGASVDAIETTNFKILNQAGFLAGSGNLVVELTEESSVELIDMNGKLLAKYTTDRVVLNPKNYTKGMYVLRISEGNNQATLKILR